MTLKLDTTRPPMQPSPTVLPSHEPFDFDLPYDLEATAPPEARGLRRDAVRLMVSRIADDTLVHTRFAGLDGQLDPGDVLVVNTSATLPAALPATRAAGAEPRRVSVHLSTRMCESVWTVEVRHPVDAGDAPVYDARVGERLKLPGGGRLRLLAPLTRDTGTRTIIEDACGCAEAGYAPDVAFDHSGGAGGVDGAGVASRVRLWLAALELPVAVERFLNRHGSPIRYSYVRDAWSLEHYQTVFASEPGSAEMPSAGRAFTPELVARLAVRGVVFAPLVLHTGVASLEDHEPPYAERFSVPAATAAVVNAARADGRRVIAVGTTAVRALESVATPAGRVKHGQGWTELVIGPERPIRVVDGLLTGFHEPRASHLHMLEALAGRRHLRVTYGAALEEGYLWHEFGDLHLILP